jgi:hypothetical protein
MPCSRKTTKPVHWEGGGLATEHGVPLGTHLRQGRGRDWMGLLARQQPSGRQLQGHEHSRRVAAAHQQGLGLASRMVVEKMGSTGGTAVPGQSATAPWMLLL